MSRKSKEEEKSRRGRIKKRKRRGRCPGPITQSHSQWNKTERKIYRIKKVKKP